MTLVQTAPKHIYLYIEIPPLCFTANTAGSTVQLTQTGTPTAVSLETSPDRVTWTDYTIGDTITLTNIGDKVYWRNKSETDTGLSIDYNNRYTFVMTGGIDGSGDVTTLLNKSGTDALSPYCFAGLFNHCSQLLTPPLLPATTLASYCYYLMFNDCSGLTTPPELPATTLATYCYSAMFQDCASLATAPELPATSMFDGCYRDMFNVCTSLTTVPKLPATSLANMCYMGMFNRCTSLNTLPELPATLLPSQCYSSMFNYCSSIKLSTSSSSTYKNAYRIPATGTGTTGTDWNYNMFTNTGGSFKSSPSINTTYYTSNTVV